MVEGNATIVEQCADAPRELQEYFSDAIGELLDNSAFLAAIPGHLAGDAASQARFAVVLDRLRTIARRAIE